MRNFAYARAAKAEEAVPRQPVAPRSSRAAPNSSIGCVSVSPMPKKWSTSAGSISLGISR